MTPKNTDFKVKQEKVQPDFQIKTRKGLKKEDSMYNSTRYVGISKQQSAEQSEFDDKLNSLSSSL